VPTTRVKVRTVCTAEAVLTPSASLAEGPVWDWTRNRLLWIDIDRMEINVSDVDRGTTETHRFGARVGSVFLGQGSWIVVAASDGLHMLDVATGRSRCVISLPADRGPNLMNDGEVDPAGRVWAGTITSDRKVPDGVLFRFDLDRSVTIALSPVSASNGLGWSPDERTMYYIDSMTQRVDVFDYHRSSGGIGNRREFVAIPSATGLPDGLTVDADGGVWVAIWGSGMVHRYTPRGQLDTIVKVPALNVSNCCFGGPSHDVLYITTATRQLASPKPSVDGAIYACRPGAIGRPGRRVEIAAL
jgi:sugar lactone lactonase YvrE